MKRRGRDPEGAAAAAAAAGVLPIPGAAAIGAITPPQAAATTVQVNFHTDVHFPVSVQHRQVNWLIVRLRLQKPETTAAAGVVPVELVIRVMTRRRRKFSPCGCWRRFRGRRRWERTITVRYDEDSDPAVFLLKSDALGKRRITIDFLHKGRQVGSVAFLTEVTESRSAGASVTLARGAAEVQDCAVLRPTPPPPADLHLRVVKKAQENTLAFWLDSPLRRRAISQRVHGRDAADQQGPADLSDAGTRPARHDGGGVDR